MPHGGTGKREMQNYENVKSYLSRVSHLPQSHRDPASIRRYIYRPLRNTINGAAPSPSLSSPPCFNHPGISLRLDDREFSKFVQLARIQLHTYSNVIPALPKNSSKRARLLRRINLCLDFAHAFHPALCIFPEFAGGLL